MSNFEYKVKRENPNDEFVLVGDWGVKSGEEVSEGDYLCSLESSKSSYDVDATRDGYIHYKMAEGERVEVGALLFVITDSEQYTWETKKKSTTQDGVKITKKAQKLIDDYSIDSAALLKAGSEKIGEKDVQAYIEENGLKSKEEKENSSETSTNIDFTDEDLSPAKKFEVHFMNQNRDVIYSRVSREISFDHISAVQEKNPGTSLGEIISYATIKAVSSFPYVNSCFNNGKIRKYNQYNLGLAINIGKGLKVPVFKNFENMSLTEISNGFKEMAMNYVRDELTGKDLTDGTFTITDLSSLGVKDFLPVVSKDQGAILGICSNSISTNTFNVVLGFDHRVMDGMYGAQFLKSIEDNLKKMVL
jgi:pyruvate/2-oxoglutarate dehydrogenase complex dihydrolipoamide acyltransferase (E2) component